MITAKNELTEKDSLKKIKFVCTDYNGYEDRIIELRNQNRTDDKSESYINWRYAGESFHVTPKVCWAQKENGKYIGMVGIIPRPYWVNDKINYFGVVGDISLNSQFRGKGIAKSLFLFLNSVIDTSLYDCAFVIPNLPAQKILSVTEWVIPEKIVSYVLYLDPSEKFTAFFKGKFLPELLSRVYRRLLKIKLASQETGNLLMMESSPNVDDSFDALWNAFPKKGLIIRDRSATSLRWRYEKHPLWTYEIKKFFHNEKFIGYCIFLIVNGFTREIVDLLAMHKKYIKPMMKILLNCFYNDNQIRVVKVKLNENHPYSLDFKSLGFCKRGGEDVFQVYSLHKSSVIDKNNWFLTYGDKDT